MGWGRLIVLLMGITVGTSMAIVSVLERGRAVLPDDTPSAGSVLQGVSAADAAQLRDFYAAMADIVVRDGSLAQPVCKTVFDLRNRHSQALAMAFARTSMVGKYQGLGERIDAYLLKAVGDLDVPLTDDLRQRASKAFAAVR